MEVQDYRIKPADRWIYLHLVPIGQTFSGIINKIHGFYYRCVDCVVDLSNPENSLIVRNLGHSEHQYISVREYCPVEASVMIGKYGEDYEIGGD